MTKRPQRIAIVGAGPVGLEAALSAVEAGFDVDVFERGRVAENVRQWGHVQLFSPFGLNCSAWGRRALANSVDGFRLPAEDELLTGREFAERYLIPLSQIPQLAGHIHEGVEVRALGRSQTWKGDLIGQPARADDTFRLLLCDSRGERSVEADCVLDCSGTYPNHNWIGAGGVPGIGETSALADDDYRLPDVLGADRSRFAGRKTLVVGSGYSAATAVVSLAQLAEAEQGTQIVWLTRSSRTPPIPRIDDDILEDRDRLTESANRLATSNDGPVEWRRNRFIRRIERRPASEGVVVSIEGLRKQANAGDAKSSLEQFAVDRVIANVGYRPDRRLYEELQVHECYATQGPMKLAAALLGETSADCLAQARHGAEILHNPEPQLFILGSKSYGRDSRFLLKIGIEQIREVFRVL